LFALLLKFIGSGSENEKKRDKTRMLHKGNLLIRKRYEFGLDLTLMSTLEKCILKKYCKKP